MTVIDYATGEVIESSALVPFAAASVQRSAQGVVDILTHARDWLASAVEMTGPAEIAAAKVSIVTAETYARELRLSKEIQEDAKEMVRRAEYALGRSIRKGQAEGTINRHGNGGTGANQYRGAEVAAPSTSAKSSPYDFAKHTDLYGDGREGGNGVLAMAEATPEQFDAALDAAKDEGNQSRANVVRKIRNIKDGGPETRDQRARKISELAQQGYSSRQIAPLVGIGEQAVAYIVRDYGIDVPADQFVKNRRRIKSSEVVENVIATIEAAIFSLELINPSEVQGDQIDSLIQSTNALRKAVNKIKESS